MSKPHEAIEQLGRVDEPMIGVCVHWFYAPHTTDGVVGRDTPLLLASNFSGQWPGLVGLLNTAASLESVGRTYSRIWTDAADWSADAHFMDLLAQWCETGRITYPENEIHYHASVSSAAARLAQQATKAIRDRRILVLMLGDTSMGMINSDFADGLFS